MQNIKVLFLLALTYYVNMAQAENSAIPSNNRTGNSSHGTLSSENVRPNPSPSGFGEDRQRIAPPLCLDARIFAGRQQHSEITILASGASTAAKMAKHFNNLFVGARIASTVFNLYLDKADDKMFSNTNVCTTAPQSGCTVVPESMADTPEYKDFSILAALPASPDDCKTGVETFLAVRAGQSRTALNDSNAAEAFLAQGNTQIYVSPYLEQVAHADLMTFKSKYRTVSLESTESIEEGLDNLVTAERDPAQPAKITEPAVILTGKFLRSYQDVHPGRFRQLKFFPVKKHSPSVLVCKKGKVASDINNRLSRIPETLAVTEAATILGTLGLGKFVPKASCPVLNSAAVR